MTTDFDNASTESLADLDASLAGHGDDWWDTFYTDRARPCPFFKTAHDESLAKWIGDGLIPCGRAIDLGCGHARNSVFLARSGFTVEGVDFSQTAIEWAKERVTAANVTVALFQESVFDVQLEPASYDLVYDSGCFHHLPPHRRKGYVELVVRALKPGGWFGLTCFRPEGGSGSTDQEVYERRTLGGGLGYTEDRLREIWSGSLRVRELRQMEKPSDESGLFGERFLWVLLAQKP